MYDHGNMQRFLCGAPGLRPGNILGKIFRGSGGGAPEKMFMMFRSTLDKMFRIFRSILVQNPGYTNRKSKYIMSTYALTLLQKFAFHLWIICSHKALSGKCYKLASGHEASEKNCINWGPERSPGKCFLSTGGQGVSGGEAPGKSVLAFSGARPGKRAGNMYWQFIFAELRFLRLFQNWLALLETHWIIELLLEWPFVPQTYFTTLLFVPQKFDS